jgi:hypothetical protein
MSLQSEVNQEATMDRPRLEGDGISGEMDSDGSFVPETELYQSRLPSDRQSALTPPLATPDEFVDPSTGLPD